MVRTATPEIWARIRSELGTTPAVAVVPKDNILLGEIAIMEYLQIREKRVLERWVDEFGLPMIKRPDGMWMSSITSIDQWILLAAKVAYANKKAQGLTTAQRRQTAAARRATLRAEKTAAQVQWGGAESSAPGVRQEALSGPAGGVDQREPGS